MCFSARPSDNLRAYTSTIPLLKLPPLAQDADIFASPISASSSCMFLLLPPMLLERSGAILDLSDFNIILLNAFWRMLTHLLLKRYRRTMYPLVTLVQQSAMQAQTRGNISCSRCCCQLSHPIPCHVQGRSTHCSACPYPHMLSDPADPA